jgi:hypothetical protein
LREGNQGLENVLGIGGFSSRQVLGGSGMGFGRSILGSSNRNLRYVYCLIHCCTTQTCKRRGIVIE